MKTKSKRLQLQKLELGQRRGVLERDAVEGEVLLPLPLEVQNGLVLTKMILKELSNLLD